MTIGMKEQPILFEEALDQIAHDIELSSKQCQMIRVTLFRPDEEDRVIIGTVDKHMWQQRRVRIEKSSGQETVNVDDIIKVELLD